MFLLIFFTLFAAVSCYNGTLHFKHDHTPEVRLRLLKPIYIVIFISGFGMLCSRLSALYKVLFSEKVFMLVGAVLIGYLAVHQPYFKFLRIGPNITFPPRHMLAFYIPVRIIKVLFGCSQHDFIRSLPYTFLIGSFGMIFVSVLHGFIMSFTASNWNFYDYFLYGIVFIPTSPDFIISQLDQDDYKDIATFLKAEYLTAQTVALIVFDILQGFHERLFNHWYQVMLVIIRYVFGAILFGYIAGLIIRFAGKISRNDPIIYLCLILGTIFSFYYLAVLIAVSPVLLIVTMCKSFFEGHDDTPDEVVFAAKSIMGTYYYIADTATFAYVTYRLSLICFSQCDFHFMYFILSYISMIVLRALAYLLMFPVIKTFCSKYHYLFLFFVIWSMTTGNVNIILTTILVYDKTYENIGIFIVPNVLFKLFATRVINNLTFVILLRYQINKNNLGQQMSNVAQCLKLINDVQARAIRMWKMDNWKFGVNWQSVKEVCQVQFPTIEAYGLGQKTLTKRGICHHCSKIVFMEESVMDKLQMRKENRRKILLHMKQIAVTQSESGVTASGCIQMITKMIDDCGKTANSFRLDQRMLKRRYGHSRILELFRKYHQTFFNFMKIEIRMPRNQFQKKCYKFYKSRYCSFLYHTCSLLVVISPMPYFIDKDEIRTTINTFLFLNLICAFMLSAMGFIAIHAHSFLWLSGGIKVYFSSIFHILDFINLIILYIDVACDFYMLITYSYRSNFVLIIKYLRLLYLTKVLELLLNQARKIINTWEELEQVNVSYVFECYLALKECLDETLLTIHRQIKMDSEFENECCAYLGKMRLEFINVISEVQAKRPSLANAVKTKQLIRAVGANMKDSVETLKHLGFVDETEYKHLKSSIKMVQVTALKAVKNINWKSKEILENISWLYEEKTTCEYLIGEAGSADFLPGEVILDVGEYSYGVYIILSGVFQLEYSTNVETMNNISNFGITPVVDHFQSSYFDRDYVDLLTVGCTFGVWSYLTGRSSDCVIKATSNAKVFFIPKNALLKGEEMIIDPIEGLRCRLWKYATYDMAIAIMITTSFYDADDMFKIAMKLRRSFIPDISFCNIFDITVHMEDVLLIDGICIGLYNHIIYKAPCYIPTTTNRLKIIKEYNPILLIIPEQGYDNYIVLHRDVIQADSVNRLSTETQLNIHSQKAARTRILPQVNRRFVD